VYKIDYEKLRLAREASGKTQVEMAREFEVSLNTYSLWERGAFNPNEVVRGKVRKFIEKWERTVNR